MIWFDSLLVRWTTNCNKLWKWSAPSPNSISPLSLECTREPSPSAWSSPRPSGPSLKSYPSHSKLKTEIPHHHPRCALQSSLPPAQTHRRIRWPAPHEHIPKRPHHSQLWRCVPPSTENPVTLDGVLHVRRLRLYWSLLWRKRRDELMLWGLKLMRLSVRNWLQDIRYDCW